MHITHSYIGTVVGDFRCLFFLLFKDYIEAETEFARELDLRLERFARDLGTTAALVRPFLGDIAAVRDHVLQKAWTRDELAQVTRTPALLMIDQNFDAFNPRVHPWLIVTLGHRDHPFAGGRDKLEMAEALLEGLVESVGSGEEDLFGAAHQVQHEIGLGEWARVFQVRPGVAGVSVDLVHAGQMFRRMLRRWQGPPNVG